MSWRERNITSYLQHMTSVKGRVRGGGGRGGVTRPPVNPPMGTFCIKIVNFACSLFLSRSLYGHRFGARETGKISMRNDWF